MREKEKLVLKWFESKLSVKKQQEAVKAINKKNEIK